MPLPDDGQRTHHGIEIHGRRDSVPVAEVVGRLSTRPELLRDPHAALRIRRLVKPNLAWDGHLCRLPDGATALLNKIRHVSDSGCEINVTQTQVGTTLCNNS